MILAVILRIEEEDCKPRTRGDDPSQYYNTVAGNEVNPARAGMILGEHGEMI